MDICKHYKCVCTWTCIWRVGIQKGEFHLITQYIEIKVWVLWSLCPFCIKYFVCVCVCGAASLIIFQVFRFWKGFLIYIFLC
jgi:hypothetical protein